MRMESDWEQIMIRLICRSSRLLMKRFVLSLFVLPVILIGCTDEQKSTVETTTVQQVAPDIRAGKSFAKANCIGCHDMDGRGTASNIPHLAAQIEEYLLASLRAYKEGKRTHAALQDMAAHMSDADIRNVVGYFASLPPLTRATAQEITLSPYEKGKAAVTACASCHGEDGNSTLPGIPSLAGQQPFYFVAAVQAYLDGTRSFSTMNPMLSGLSKADMENMARYYASQSPVKRETPSFGNPAVGEPLSAFCGGCHGFHGISNDAATPSLAGQDAQYLLSATKAYRDGTRQHAVMRGFVANSGDEDIEHIAAFYAVQKPMKAKFEKLIPVQELVELCARCHSPGIESPTLTFPKISGQNKDYLITALDEYRDGKRGASMMHKIILPRSDSTIESIATWYSNQPAR